MEIKYYIRDIYGTAHRFVKDKDLERVIKKITGKKTLTAIHMTNFKKLGITFRNVTLEDKNL